jgi:hypothetical protein
MNYLQILEKAAQYHVGFAPQKGVDSVLECFPSNQLCLVPPTCGKRKPLGCLANQEYKVKHD